MSGDTKLRAVVALGANLGDPVRTVRKAAVELAHFSAGPLSLSNLWQTVPVNCPPGSPLFINAVVMLEPLPGETPESLLEKLHALESRFGRMRDAVINAPRPLDLDLIAFGAETRKGPGLILPHPRAAERRFVLEPLAELDPHFILPGQSKTVQELLHQLPRDPRMVALG